MAITRYASEAIKDRHIFYNGRLIGCSIWAFDGYQFRWLWTTVTHHLSFFWGWLCRSEWRWTHIISSRKDSPGSVDFSDVQIMYKFTGWVVRNPHFILLHHRTSFSNSPSVWLSVNRLTYLLNSWCQAQRHVKPRRLPSAGCCHRANLLAWSQIDPLSVCTESFATTAVICFPVMLLIINMVCYKVIKSQTLATASSTS